MSSPQPLSTCSIPASQGDYNRVARQGIIEHIFSIYPAQGATVVLNYDQRLQGDQFISITRINISLRDSAETTKNRLAARLSGTSDEGLGYETSQEFLRQVPRLLEEAKRKLG